MSDRISFNWSVAAVATATLLSGAAWGFLVETFFWQGAILAAAVLGVGLAIKNYRLLWLEEPGPVVAPPPAIDQETLLTIVALLQEILRELRYLKEEFCFD